MTDPTAAAPGAEGGRTMPELGDMDARAIPCRRPTRSWTRWPTTSRRSSASRVPGGRTRLASCCFPRPPPEEPRADGRDPRRRRRDLIVPNATHWQHPGFMAYFATTGVGAGILGEMLTATLGQNPMLWRTSPIGTELEAGRRRLAPPGARAPGRFDGLITDTASTSSLIALAGGAKAAGFAAADGLTGRPEGPTTAGVRIGRGPQRRSRRHA